MLKGDQEVHTRSAKTVSSDNKLHLLF